MFNSRYLGFFEWSLLTFCKSRRDCGFFSQHSIYKPHNPLLFLSAHWGQMPGSYPPSFSHHAHYFSCHQLLNLPHSYPRDLAGVWIGNRSTQRWRSSNWPRGSHTSVLFYRTFHPELTLKQTHSFKPGTSSTTDHNTDHERCLLDFRPNKWLERVSQRDFHDPFSVRGAGWCSALVPFT